MFKYNIHNKYNNNNKKFIHKLTHVNLLIIIIFKLTWFRFFLSLSQKSAFPATFYLFFSFLMSIFAHISNLHLVRWHEFQIYTMNCMHTHIWRKKNNKLYVHTHTHLLYFFSKYICMCVCVCVYLHTYIYRLVLLLLLLLLQQWNRH